ncbi:TIGR03086 family protein [Nocardia higoensis]|uniref:TIGR03086 family protein n=1 Tax=Nocardia higoensis TaxID=228599 RepID=A0ABS0D541_9NOCA|nr:TIGR03086 family protein [Nocardia higoensis]
MPYPPRVSASQHVRALVNHWVLYSSHGLECRAQRRPIPDKLTERDFTDAADWAEEYVAQLDRAVRAWSEPAVWEGEIDLGWATMPAADVAGMLLAELALHGWDVAAATGQEFRVSEGSAVTLGEIVAASAEEYRAYSMFAAAVEIEGGADPFSRYVAASGRNPQWAAGIRA